MKEIHFYEGSSFPADCLHSWDATNTALQYGVQTVHTTQMGFLDWSLFDKGYKVFIHPDFAFGGRTPYEVYKGWEAPSNRLLQGTENLLKLWQSGEFDAPTTPAAKRLDAKLLRETYPAGTVIRLTAPMEDPAGTKPVGSLAQVTDVDDSGLLHCKWKGGGSLAVIPELDRFEVVSPKIRVKTQDVVTFEPFPVGGLVLTLKAEPISSGFWGIWAKPVPLDPEAPSEYTLVSVVQCSNCNEVVPEVNRFITGF